jgi:mRNA interferase HigB
MRVVGRELLEKFVADHADARSWIESWLAEAEAAAWRTPQDIKSRYSSASFLPNNLVVLNVKGNRYRLEMRVAYGVGVVVVLWLGTHAEYSKRRGG